MSVTEIITTEAAQEGFYPTPPAVADKLLEGIEWDVIETVLEPSAGKGNIVDRIAEKWNSSRLHSRRGSHRTINVDCIEIDPYLRSILQYEFGGQKEAEIRDRLRGFDEKQKYNSATKRYGELTEREKAEKATLTTEEEKRQYLNFHIIHDDFLSFRSHKKYGLIVMNPPFANGDEHLLKAIQLQQANGGQIRCLLNAETLRNPYTNRRKMLNEKLESLGAEISFLEGAFAHGERQADVNCAVVKLNIPAEGRESEIFKRLQEAEEIKTEPAGDVTDLTIADFLQQIVSRFNVETAAGVALIREYIAMRPYIMDSMKETRYSRPTLTLCVGDPSRCFSRDYPNLNKFLQKTRLKYWEALFSNDKFVGKLTSNLREKYSGMVDRMKDYDFTLFNIQQIAAEMNAEMCQGVQDTIVALFDRMTTAHTWYPECGKNVHYYNGWKTNKAHKINGKVILPVNGMFSDYSWNKDSFDLRVAENTISDIEKVFEYLDGNMSAPVSLHGVLQTAHDNHQTKNIQCKFFSVTLYKKGTMHIKFNNQALVDRFNIYCCQKKNWLPPNYGKAAYSDMSAEEKATVDGFHADGKAGSGEAAYMKIVANSGYFLAEPTQAMPALMAPA
jgi:hypothetical protein